jgi:hypothetical protein
MISQTRDYIRRQVLVIDPTQEEWEDAFNIDNIPSNIYNKAFHILYEVPTIVRGQGLYDFNVNATLTLFYKADRNVQETFDSAMDIANSIALSLGNVNNIEEYKIEKDSDNPIYGVEVTSIIPSNPVSNDNRVIVTLSISLGIQQSVC